MKKIKIWWVSVLLVAFISSCGIIKPIPIENNTNTIVNYVDSINYIDSTIYHHIYKEYYKDYTDLLDTLNLETTYSKSKCWVDTTDKKLKGEIYNKPDSIPEKIKWKEKIVYKDSIQIQEKEIPVPYEVVKYKTPKWCWWNLVYSILLTAGLVLWILKKLKIISI